MGEGVWEFSNYPLVHVGTLVVSDIFQEKNLSLQSIIDYS
jgi:hypothetical protein